MHQAATLVSRKLGPAAGAQAQHVLQKVAVPAGIIFFQLARRDAQPPAQQFFQCIQVADLPGRSVRHPAQQLQALRLLAAGGAQGLGQAGAFRSGQGPAAAQAVEAVGGGRGQVGQSQLRRGRFQRLHDRLQRRAEGLPLPLGPAQPQPSGRGGERLIEADLLADHPVLKAVGQVDLLRHQGVAVGVGQQARLAGGRGELALGKAQHEDIVWLVQPHLARAGQHHGIQRLRDMPQVGRTQQQPEQVFVFGHRHGLLAQQAGHLVQQLHDHVPLAGGLFRHRDAPRRSDGFHLRRLLLLCAQLSEAEVERAADGLGVGVPHLAAQSIGGVQQQSAGLFGIGQIPGVLFGQLPIAEAFGVVPERCPPCRRIGRPGIGVVFEGADLFFGQGAQARFGQRGQILGQVGPAGQRQQCPDRRGRGAELRGSRLIAVERDARHPELIPHSGAVLADVAADHRDPAAPHPLPHQAADGTGGGAGLLFPAGRSKQPHLVRRRFQRCTGAGLQQRSHCRKAGGLGVPQVPPEQLGRSHLGPIFAGQLAQLRGHLLGPRKQAHIAGHERCPIVAQGHRHPGQSGQQRPQQPLFGRVEGIELVDEDLPLLQKSRHCAASQRLFEPRSGQLQPVGGVHAAAGEQGLVALKDQGQLPQFAALGSAAFGKVGQLLAGQARALELVDGLGGHLAERCAPPVAVVVMDVFLQFLQCAAHQHSAACVRKGLHGCAALHGQDLLGQARERKALHHAGKRIAQFAVDAPLGGGGELFRHQQDALLTRLSAGTDAVIQQRRLAAARPA